MKPNALLGRAPAFSFVLLAFSCILLSCLWIWIGYFSFGFFWELGPGVTLVSNYLCSAVFFAAFGCTLFLRALFVDKTPILSQNAKMAIFVAIPIATIALLAISLYVDSLSGVLIVIAFAVAGVGSGHLLLQWGQILCANTTLHAMVMLCISAAVGFFVLSLFSTMQPPALLLTLLLTFAMSGFFALRIYEMGPTSDPITKDESIHSFDFLPKLSMTNLIYGIVFGYSIGFALRSHLANEVPGPMLEAIFIALASGLLALIIGMKKSHISFPNMQRTTFACVIGLLILQVLTTDAFALLNGLMLVAVTFLYGLNNLNVLVVIAIKRNLNCIYHMGAGFWPYVIGAGIGLCGMGIADAAGWLAPETRMFVTLGLVIIVALSTAFSMFARDSITSTMTNQAQEATSEDDHLGEAQLCEHYNLSAREREVFSYLVRGRNSRYIQEKLVISEHTVKTHIHHIYQKTGVSSRQQLIDLVEDRS